MEQRRPYGVATKITFPLKDITGELVSGATGLDSEIDVWDDDTAPDGFVDCTNEATEIGSTGEYYLTLTAGEMSSKYIVISVTSNEAIQQVILIQTYHTGYLLPS